jgi:hypothetical protein
MRPYYTAITECITKQQIHAANPSTAQAFSQAAEKAYKAFQIAINKPDELYPALSSEAPRHLSLRTQSSNIPHKQVLQIINQHLIDHFKGDQSYQQWYQAMPPKQKTKAAQLIVKHIATNYEESQYNAIKDNEPSSQQHHLLHEPEIQTQLEAFLKQENVRIIKKMKESIQQNPQETTISELYKSSRALRSLTQWLIFQTEHLHIHCDTKRQDEPTKKTGKTLNFCDTFFVSLNRYTSKIFDALQIKCTDANANTFCTHYFKYIYLTMPNSISAALKQHYCQCTSPQQANEITTRAAWQYKNKLWEIMTRKTFFKKMQHLIIQQKALRFFQENLPKQPQAIGTFLRRKLSKIWQDNSSYFEIEPIAEALNKILKQLPAVKNDNNKENDDDNHPQPQQPHIPETEHADPWFSKQLEQITSALDSSVRHVLESTNPPHHYQPPAKRRRITQPNTPPPLAYKPRPT